MDARIHLERPLIRSSQLRGHSEDSSLAGDSAENPRRRDAQRALGGRITEFLKEKADRQAAYERMPPEERDHSAHNRNVARLDYEIKKLCIHLNTLAPIFSLPPELLGAVFYNYATDLKRARNSYPWMHLLHVCHHWREVAFSTPMLWTMIRTIKPEIVNFQLAHAATMPLTVTIPNDLSCDAYHDGILERLLLELPRIRKLRYFMRRGFESLAWENAQADAPMLEDLELEFGENSWYERRPLPGFKDMALPKLGILRFIGDEHVSIETVLSVVRPTLTMLELNRWSTHQMKELVLILATLPGLKVFRCAMYYRKDEEDEHSEAPEPPHVALPHLSELYLYDPSMGAATISLLNKVTIPYDCIIQLELNNTYCPFTPWRVARIVNYVRRHFPSLLSPHTVGFLDIDPFTTLERPGEITWVMGMWADEQDPYNVFSTGRSIGREGTLGAFFIIRGEPEIVRNLFLSNLDAAAVKCLCVQVCLEPNEWQKISRKAPNITRLHVDESYGHSLYVGSPDAPILCFLEALSPYNIPSGEGDYAAQSCFPALQTLFLGPSHNDLHPLECYIGDNILLHTLTSLVLTSLRSHESVCGERLPALALSQSLGFEEAQISRYLQAGVADLVWINGSKYSCEGGLN